MCQIRRWLPQAAPTTSEYFTTVIRGGAWTRAHLHRDYDSVRAQARGQTAKAWCTKFNLAKSMDFGIPQPFSETTAHVMALEWCRKMDFFFVMALSSGGDPLAYMYTDSDVRAYSEGEDFAKLVVGCASGSRLADKARQIRALGPR